MQFQVAFCLWSFLADLCLGITNAKLLQRSRKSRDNVIGLTDENYQRILGTGHDSWILVYFTSSSPQIGCSTCIEVAEEYKVIANSWFKDHPSGISTAVDGGENTSLFFAISDLNGNRIPDVFSFYGIEHVPRLLLFEPGAGIHGYQTIDIMGEGGMERILGIVNDIKKATSITDFNIHKPMNWSLIIISTVLSFCISYMFRRHYEVTTRVLSMRSLWGLLWTFFTILMLGGYMYNLIRNSQLAGVTENGGLIYFLPAQSSSQFRIETQIVSVIYSSLVAGVIGLALVVLKLTNRYKNTNKSGMIEVGSSIMFAVIVYAFFAGLTSIYEIKQPGYPYPLLRISSFLK